MVPTDSTALKSKVRKGLQEFRRQLQLMQSELVVSTQMLKEQNADLDGDIANILEFDVGTRVDAQIEAIDALIAAMDPRAAGACPMLQEEEPEHALM